MNHYTIISKLNEIQMVGIFNLAWYIYIYTNNYVVYGIDDCVLRNAIINTYTGSWYFIS